MECLDFLRFITEQFAIHSICVLLGPDQCGKTTFAQGWSQNYFQESVYHFDLESSEDFMALQEPMCVLERFTGLIIIDEIQRFFNLFALLRVFH